MNQNVQTPVPQLFDALFGEDTGPLVRMALTNLALVGPEAVEKAIDKLSRTEVLGPMLDPTAWLGNQRFDNARDVRLFLHDLLGLTRKLQKMLPNGG